MKEIAMNIVRRISRSRRIARAVAVLAAVLAAASVTPAFASIPHEPAGSGGAGVPHAHAAVRTIAAGGMPGWQIALIAVGAAVLAATLAVVADHVLAAHRRTLTAAA
jgi:hypothetical protein